MTQRVHESIEVQAPLQDFSSRSNFESSAKMVERGGPENQAPSR